MLAKLTPTIIAVTMLLAPCAFAGDAQAVIGFWYTENDQSMVEITKREDKFFGNIVWIADPRYEEGDKDAGKLKFDRENKKKKLRKRPIVGLPFMNDFTYDAKEDYWANGTIYDPEKGKTYKCEMRVVPNEAKKGTVKLHVRGYIGIPTLGRTTEWLPTPDEDVEKNLAAAQADQKK